MISQSISILLDGVRQAYIDEQKAKGIRSSGKSAESLRIETKETSGTLYGARYFFQQKHGRKPGKFPPLDAILDWMREKGIRPGLYQPTPKVGRKIAAPVQMSERSLSFIIAQKIANSGTDIFQKKREGLNVDERIKELMKEFRSTVVKDFKGEIVKSLQ